MEDEDYKRYVCVEPGCVNGMTTVEAKKELVLKQTIVVVKEMWIVCWILGRERRNGRLSIQTEHFVCSLVFGELEGEQFVFLVDSSGDLGEQRVVSFLQLYSLIETTFQQ